MPHATEGPAVKDQRSVLVVDSSEETHEVLQAALARRGVRILSANRVQQGLELARQHHPDLVVLDLEIDEPLPDDPSDCFARQSPAEPPSMVLLGSMRRRRSTFAGRSGQEGGYPPVAGQFVAKPYHYGPLIRKIEELLEPIPRPSSDLVSGETEPREHPPCRRCS